MARVNICLVNKDSQAAILHSITPFPIPFTRYVPVKCEFSGPDIGTITDVIVSPESGTLSVASILIQTNDKNQYDMEPSLTHDNVFIPKRCFSPERKAQYDTEYKAIKMDIYMYELFYSFIGTAFTWQVLGPSDAFAYLLGTILAAMYHTLLQYQVDTMGTPRVKIDSATRLASFAVVSGIMVQHFAEEIQHHSLYYILALLGFMSYKISLMSVMSKQNQNHKQDTESD